MVNKNAHAHVDEVKINMNWKCGIFSLLLVIAGAITVPFMGGDVSSQNKIEQTNAVEVVETFNPTNSVPSSTNQVDRASPNTSWFKDSSNYIWDGWKIK